MAIVNSLSTKYQCQCGDLLMDTAPERGGTGQGFGPHDLLETALAACLNISVRRAAVDLGFDLDKVETSARLDRSQEGRTIFRYSCRIQDDIPEADKTRILQALDGCAVRKTLSQRIDFEEVAGLLG